MKHTIESKKDIGDLARDLLESNYPGRKEVSNLKYDPLKKAMFINSYLGLIDSVVALMYATSLADEKHELARHIIILDLDEVVARQVIDARIAHMFMSDPSAIQESDVDGWYSLFGMLPSNKDYLSGLSGERRLSYTKKDKA